ncbi:AraC family transcriptional regulator [Paenibacillus sp. NPDC058177]|uniref:AraC family transcriptional regulator n=1 Tax=Paenibacillus sp. NPDC058177 TaxID=3346369 RepID=UPI0036DA3B7A
MNNRQLILKALNLIEDHLTASLPVAALSNAMGYSLYHFIRLFQAVTGMAPGEYIIRRKITEAALDIIHSPDRSFLDISLHYHFNNYETFTRAFKRLLHTTPTLVRKRQAGTMLPLLHRMHERDLLHLSATFSTPPQLVELGEIILQGPLARVKNNPDVITQTWPRLFNSIHNIPQRKLPEKYYQVAYWPEKDDHSAFSVMCACELLASLLEQSKKHHDFQSRVLETSFLDESLNILSHTGPSADFPIHRLPPARYLRFIHKGLSREVSSTYKYIYGIWLPKTDYRLSLPYEFEYYGDAYLGPDNESSLSEIYIPLELL